LLDNAVISVLWVIKLKPRKKIIEKNPNQYYS